MTGEYEVKKQIIEVGRRIYQNGFVAANDGNISVKISDNEFLCTPTGVSKGFMTMDMICKVDGDGKVLSASGPYRPSSEIKMHLRVYKLRPDVKSVVHAHPPYATSHAIAGIPLTEPIMPEAVIALGCVPIAEYGTPSTNEIPDAVEKYLQYYDAVLLENHGALTYSDSLMNAYFKMESLEFYAKLMTISKMLGGAKVLNPEQVEKLYDLRRKMGLSGKHPADLCAKLNGPCNGCHAHGGSCSCGGHDEPASDDLVAEVTKRILAELKNR